MDFSQNKCYSATILNPFSTRRTTRVILQCRPPGLSGSPATWITFSYELNKTAAIMLPICCFSSSVVLGSNRHTSSVAQATKKIHAVRSGLQKGYRLSSTPNPPTYQKKLPTVTGNKIHNVNWLYLPNGMLYF